MGIVGTSRGRIPAARIVRNTLASAIAATVLAVGALTAQPLQAQTTLRAVMHSDLKIVDPIFTTAYITRNHGYMIYDTLFATDAKGEVKPQMVDKYTVSDDKLKWTFTLRDDFARETDPAKQKEIALAVRNRMVNEYPTHIYLGQWYQPVAHRSNISGILEAPAIGFWNIEKKK